MRQLLFFLALIPALLAAQTDQRYLAGAVPTVNGKVVFSQEIQAPNLNQQQIYDTLLNWAKQTYNTNDRRVVYQNREEGTIAVVSKEYIVFTSNALALDRSLTTYQLTMKCQDQHCRLEIGGIRFIYNVSYQDEPEIYLAEKWITDNIALNGKKTKLNRISGKFRKGIIDVKDKTFESAANALGITTTVAANNTPAPQATVVAPQKEVVPQAAAVVPQKVTATPQQTKSMEGFVAFEPGKVPSTLLQMLPSQQMSVKAGTSTSADNETEWKGIGNMFGKPVATFTINPASATYKALSENDTYSVTFSKEGESSPWFVMECKKQGETDDGQQKAIVGEILNIWIK